MRKKWLISGLMLCLSSFNLFATGNVPIQRVDIVNVLGDGGSATAVTIVFSNGGASPCYTMTLPFQNAVTVLAGIGQPCVAPINNIVVTTLGDVYDNTPLSYNINTNFYLAQMTISQLTAPVFDSSTGAVITPGFAEANITSRLQG